MPSFTYSHCLRIVVLYVGITLSIHSVDLRYVIMPVVTTGVTPVVRIRIDWTRSQLGEVCLTCPTCQRRGQLVTSTARGQEDCIFFRCVGNVGGRLQTCRQRRICVLAPPDVVAVPVMTSTVAGLISNKLHSQTTAAAKHSRTPETTTNNFFHIFNLHFGECSR